MKQAALLICRYVIPAGVAAYPIQPVPSLPLNLSKQENCRGMDLAVFRFEYLQGTKQEFWILLADTVTDPGEIPCADLRNQRHGP